MKRTRWAQYTQCTCKSQGCSKNLLGYTTQSKQMAATHRRADATQALTAAAAAAAADAAAAMEASSSTHAAISSRTGLCAEAGGSRSTGASNSTPLADPCDEDFSFDDSGFYSAGDVSNDARDARDPSPELQGNAPDAYSRPEAPVLAPAPGEDTTSPSRANTPRSDDLPDAADDLAALLNCVLDLEDQEFVPAFRERADIRLLYLQVVLANVFGNATVDESEQRLRDGLDLLALSSEGLPTRPKPAETLATAKKRLGLNVDDYLFKRAICSECFKPYKEEDITNSASPACVVKKCPGVFYRIKHDIDGKERRVPAKVHTYVSLIKTLQRFFLRPDFVRSFQLPSVKLDKPPLQDDEYMHDFHDGVAYGAYTLDMKRVVMPDGSVADVKIRRGPHRTLMSVDIGISMTINVDWYVGIHQRSSCIHPHAYLTGTGLPKGVLIR